MSDLREPAQLILSETLQLMGLIEKSLAAKNLKDFADEMMPYLDSMLERTVRRYM